jgi:hypothetical protein
MVFCCNLTFYINLSCALNDVMMLDGNFVFDVVLDSML